MDPTRFGMVPSNPIFFSLIKTGVSNVIIESPPSCQDLLPGTPGRNKTRRYSDIQSLKIFGSVSFHLMCPFNVSHSLL